MIEHVLEFRHRHCRVWKVGDFAVVQKIVKILRGIRIGCAMPGQKNQDHVVGAGLRYETAKACTQCFDRRLLILKVEDVVCGKAASFASLKKVAKRTSIGIRK